MQSAQVLLPQFRKRAGHTGRLIRSYLTASALSLLALWALANWTASLAGISAMYIEIPTWDYWRIPHSFLEARALNPSFLWRQHNEHRIVFPELVFVSDFFLTHGSRVLPLAVSLLCYAGCLLVIARTVLSEVSISRPVQSTIILLAAVVMASRGCTLALADPFLLQWTLTALMVMISLLLLTSVPRQNSPWPLSGALAAAVVATYSSGNGLLQWPVLIGAALILRLTRKQLLATVATAAVASGLYFVGYRFSGALDLEKLLLHPVMTLNFAAAYLSMPFGNMKSPQFSLYVGFANLLIAVSVFAGAVRSNRLATRIGIVLFGFYALRPTFGRSNGRRKDGSCRPVLSQCESSSLSRLDHDELGCLGLAACLDRCASPLALSSRSRAGRAHFAVVGRRLRQTWLVVSDEQQNLRRATGHGA